MRDSWRCDLRKRIIAGVLLAVYLPACQTWRTEAVAPAQFITAKQPDKVRVSSADGKRVVVVNPTVEGDTLHGTAEHTSGRVTRVAIPLVDLRNLETEHTNTGRTLLLGSGIALGVVWVAACISQKDTDWYKVC